MPGVPVTTTAALIGEVRRRQGELHGGQVLGTNVVSRSVSLDTVSVWLKNGSLSGSMQPTQHVIGLVEGNPDPKPRPPS